MAVGKAQPVGKAVIVYGTVKAVSADGLERVLTPNSVIYADDRIVTGSDGSISITFTGSPNAMMLGRMSDVLIDEEVYGGTAADGSGDFSASVADIQQALEQDPDLDPGEVLPPPAAGAGVAGAGGGGRQIVVFDATQMEVTPDSGAETRGIGWDFLDPPYWVYPGVDDGAEAPFEPPIDGEVVVPVPPPVPPPGPAPTVSMDSITVNEGEPAVFEIHLTGVGEGSTLALTLADGSAVSPDDYASGGLEYSLDGGTTWSEYTGPVSVPAGESVVLVRTDTVNDTIDEPDETFTLNAVVTSNGTPYSDSATATIIDDDVPTISVGAPGTGTGDITVPEGEPAVFEIHLTGVGEGSTLALTLADGSAVSPDDYASGGLEYSLDGGTTWSEYTGPVSVPAGESVVLVRTDTVNDTIDEPDETFTLNAVVTSNGTPYSDSATATIIDDDVPTISVGAPGTGTGDITVPEGEPAVFEIHLTGVGEGSTLELTLADGSAVSPDDYASGGLEYSLDGGTTWSEYTGPVSVPAGESVVLVRTDTVNDTIDEPDETFTLNAVVTSNGTEYSDSATATIIDDDVPTISVGAPGTGTGDITVPEGEPAVFEIHLTGVGEGSTLELTLADDSAVSPDDYASGGLEYSLDGGTTWSEYTGPVSVPAGESVVLVRTDTVNDTIDEPDETFTLNAVVTSNGTPYSDSATATIIDDDVPTISVGAPGTGTGDITVPEGEPAVFEIHLTGVGEGSTLALTLADGSAVSPDDYASGGLEYSLDGGTTWSEYTGPVSVPAGESVVLVRTDTVNDTIDEPDETFTLNAVVTSNGTPYSDSATATIIDDDIIDGDEQVTTQEDTPLTGNVLDNATNSTGPVTVAEFTVAGDSTVYQAGQTVEISGVGQLVIHENGDYRFTPHPDYSGQVPSVTYTVTDGIGSDTSALNITVTPVADIPRVTITPQDPVTVNTVINSANVTSTDQGFTVKAFDLDGNEVSIATADGVEDAPTGFGVPGYASGDPIELGQDGYSSERIEVTFDTPVTEATVRFAWLASVERAEYMLYDIDGNQIGGGIIQGITDVIDPPITLQGTGGTLIHSIVFTAPIDGEDNDYLIHDISFPTDTLYPINLVVEPTDTDFSETIVSVALAVPEGAVLSAGTLNADGTWTLPLESDGSYTVVIDPVTNAVTVEGLEMTVPGTTGSAPDISVIVTVQDSADGGLTDTKTFIIGTDADNTLVGGDGDDILIGGGGADRFIVGDGHDTIMDYNRAEGDLVDISSVINSAEGDYSRLGIADNGGKAQLLLYDDADHANVIGSVTFDTIDFSSLDTGNELNSLLGQIDLDHTA